MADIWREIPGFDGYEITRKGAVRSWLTPGRPTKRSARAVGKKAMCDRQGRLFVKLRVGKEWRTCYVDELVHATWEDRA